MLDGYKIEGRENLLTGILGALLFSMIGAVIWVALWKVRIIEAICGAVTIIAAIKGYKILGRKESFKGIIISIVIAAVVLVLAWHFGLSLDLYRTVRENYIKGIIDYKISFGEALGNPYYFFKDTLSAVDNIKDLAVALGFCVVIGVVCAVEFRKKKKKCETKEDIIRKYAEQYKNQKRNGK